MVTKEKASKLRYCAFCRTNERHGKFPEDAMEKIAIGGKSLWVCAPCVKSRWTTGSPASGA